MDWYYNFTTLTMCKKNEDLGSIFHNIFPWKFLLKSASCGTWVTQSVMCLTLDFHSGHDLRVLGSSPMSGSMLGIKSI